MQVLLHKLALLRDQANPPREFRRLLHECTLHLGCEAIPFIFMCTPVSPLQRNVCFDIHNADVCVSRGPA